MGYDITFHPISEEQMDAWYFSLLDSLAKGDTSRLEAVAEDAGMDPFYINKYRDLMKYAAGTPPSERFETTHGFYMAVVQGFFRKHYYVRGTAVSFMAEEYPMMEMYITPWKDILPEGILPPAQQGIVENYSAGVYLSAEQVKELLSDYERNKEVRKAGRTSESAPRCGGEWSGTAGSDRCGGSGTAGSEKNDILFRPESM